MNKQPLNFRILFLVMIILSGCVFIPTQTSPVDHLPGQGVSPDQRPDMDGGQIEVKLEQNDWSSIWINDAAQSEKPRLLFVGDSVTEGYYPYLEEDLSQVFSLGYYVTSKFLANPDFQTELTTILDRYDFEMIHINNGLHGWDYSIEEYRTGLEDLKTILDDHAPNTMIIWCTTTPIRVDENLTSLGKLNGDVVSRNQAALEILGENGVIINDLYQELLEHPEYYRDGLHFNSAGKEFQAKVITDLILAYH